jgi:adenylate kinase family enzyme
MRLHIVGASGSGTTTLGTALSSRLGIPHFDADDYYWIPADPPFEAKRPIPQRQELLRSDLESHSSWILSGSIVSWGDPFLPMFDAVVFRFLPRELRMTRLRRREADRYGPREIAPGGRHHEATESFLAWAASYDDPDFVGRSLLGHEAWLQLIECPVVRLDGDLSVEESVQHVLDAVAS